MSDPSPPEPTPRRPWWRFNLRVLAALLMATMWAQYLLAWRPENAGLVACLVVLCWTVVSFVDRLRISMRPVLLGLQENVCHLKRSMPGPDPIHGRRPWWWFNLWVLVAPLLALVWLQFLLSWNPYLTVFVTCHLVLAWVLTAILGWFGNFLS